MTIDEEAYRAACKKVGLPSGYWFHRELIEAYEQAKKPVMGESDGIGAGKAAEGNLAKDYPSPANLVQKLLKDMTDEQRLEIIADYCGYCGCYDADKPRGCQCWNDE